MPTPKIERPHNSQVQHLYEADFYAWTQQQAEFLRGECWPELDLPNLIEEIESLGRQERAELRHRLRVLVGHLLKWEHQPSRRSRSWVVTIRTQRSDVQDLLTDNPSLRPYLRDALERMYARARDLAEVETRLPAQTFPASCPYSVDEILSDRFYPGPPAAPDLTN